MYDCNEEKMSIYAHVIYLVYICTDAKSLFLAIETTTFTFSCFCI